MFELDDIQKEIVQSESDKILVIAGSGSGKTRVLTERIKNLLKIGVKPEKIVAITFTNAAADEMRERLGDKSTDMYIGTIHGYANRLLLLNGIETSSFIDSENFDALFNEIKNNQTSLEYVEHLLVDEFQDIDDNQYEFLFEMIKPKNFFVVGDDYQNIYSWRGSNVQHFLNLFNNNEVTVYKMENNYRTGRNIVSFAMGFLRPIKRKINKKIICKNLDKGEVIELETPDLSYIVNEIAKEKNYGDWFILTRKNSEIDMTISTLKKMKIPYDTFKKSDLNSEQLKTKMKENTVKVLTVHSAKGLENENVAVLGVSPRSEEERRVAYVAATRAKTKLIWCYNYSPRAKAIKSDIVNWE